MTKLTNLGVGTDTAMALFLPLLLSFFFFLLIIEVLHVSHSYFSTQPNKCGNHFLGEVWVGIGNNVHQGVNHSFRPIDGRPVKFDK